MKWVFYFEKFPFLENLSLLKIIIGAICICSVVFSALFIDLMFF